jgi:hypothetical protein
VADRNRGNNYAAVQLENGDIVVAHSTAGLHAEKALLELVGDRSIVSIYTERQPCENKCESLLSGIPTSWSWDWNGVDRAKVNSRIKVAVRKLFV